MSWDDTKQATDTILSADYNSMVTDQKTRAKVNNENKRGSDCTGSSGDTGRVLTLTNTEVTTDAGILVFRNGAMIMPTDLTIVNNASASTITFTNTNIFDTDHIRVIYFT